MTRSLGAGSVLAAVAAITLAGAAHAAPPLINGTYSGADGDDENTWSITTTCAPTGCTGSGSSNPGWTSPMTLRDGLWYFSVTKPDGFVCADGSYQPAMIWMELDPATLAGVISADSNGACPGGITSATPFQLKAA